MHRLAARSPGRPRRANFRDTHNGRRRAIGLSWADLAHCKLKVGNELHRVQFELISRKNSFRAEQQTALTRPRGQAAAAAQASRRGLNLNNGLQLLLLLLLSPSHWLASKPKAKRAACCCCCWLIVALELGQRRAVRWKPARAHFRHGAKPSAKTHQTGEKYKFQRL